jgi:hypothetical protein
MPRTHLVGRQVAPLLLRRSQVLAQDVGSGAEALEAIAARDALEIDDRAALARIAVEKRQSSRVPPSGRQTGGGAFPDRRPVVPP